MESKKHKFGHIGKGEIVLIHNEDKLEEGMMIYFNEKNKLEAKTFRLTTMEKECVLPCQSEGGGEF